LVLLFVVVPGRAGPAALDRLLSHEERATAVLSRDFDVKAVAARQRDDVVRPAGSGGHLHNGRTRRLGRWRDASEGKRDQRFDERPTSRTNADHADLPEGTLDCWTRIPPRKRRTET